MALQRSGAVERLLAATYADQSLGCHPGQWDWLLGANTIATCCRVTALMTALILPIPNSASTATATQFLVRPECQFWQIARNGTLVKPWRLHWRLGTTTTTTSAARTHRNSGWNGDRLKVC